MPILGRSYQVFIALQGLYIVFVFVAIARWCRADSRRVARAVVAAFAAGTVNIGLDVIAHHFEWWRYPEATTPFGPLLYYVLAGLGFGALALFTFRLQERFGGKAIVAMLVVMCVYGPARDHLTDHLIQLIEFRSGAGIVIADAVFEWVIPYLVALTVIGGQTRLDAQPHSRSGTSG